MDDLQPFSVLHLIFGGIFLLVLTLLIAAGFDAKKADKAADTFVFWLFIAMVVIGAIFFIWKSEN